MSQLNDISMKTLLWHDHSNTERFTTRVVHKRNKRIVSHINLDKINNYNYVLQ